MAPILDELENAVLEHDVYYEGERELYPDECVRAIATVFADIMFDKTYTKLLAENIPLEQIDQIALKCGQDIRNLVKTYTGLDTVELAKQMAEGNAE